MAPTTALRHAKPDDTGHRANGPLAGGKGGVPLRKAMDAALNLTPEQTKQFNKLHREVSQLTRELRKPVQR